MQAWQAHLAAQAQLFAASTDAKPSMEDHRWGLFSPFAAQRCALLDMRDLDGDRQCAQADATPAATSSMRSLEDRIGLSWLLHEPTINHQQSPFANAPDTWDLFPPTPVQHPPLHATRQRSASVPDVLVFDRTGASPWSLAHLNAHRPVTLPGSPTQHVSPAMHHMLGTTPSDPHHAAPMPHLAPAPDADTAALDELLAKLVALRLQGIQAPLPPSATPQALDVAATDAAPVRSPKPAPRREPDSPALDGLPKYAKTVLYKTEPCRGWEAVGSCRYGVRCQFAHGAHELRPVPRPKSKTVVHGRCS